MPHPRLSLVLLAALSLAACQSETPAEQAAEPAVLDGDAAMEALDGTGENVTPEDTTSLGEALDVTAEEIGAGSAPVNTENAQQQPGTQPGGTAE